MLLFRTQSTWPLVAQVLGKLSDQQRSLLEERFKAAERQAAAQGLDIGYRRLERANGASNGYAQDGGYPQDSGYAADAGYVRTAICSNGWFAFGVLSGRTKHMLCKCDEMPNRHHGPSRFKARRCRR